MVKQNEIMALAVKDQGTILVLQLPKCGSFDSLQCQLEFVRL